MLHTTLITGASSGIGMELARISARKGRNILITARRVNRLNKLKDELKSQYGINVYILPLDLAENNAPLELFDFVQKSNLTIDVLINNAGVGDFGFFYESNWNWQQTMIDLNIKSLTHLTHLFLPQMIQLDRAYIMNVASNAAFQPGPLMSVYYATKHYVLAFSEAVANELQDTGVTVTALCPGPTKSEFQETASMQKSRLINTVPLPDSKRVAEYGYKALMRSKRVAVHGSINKIFSVAVRLLPKRLVTSIVRRMQATV